MTSSAIVSGAPAASSRARLFTTSATGTNAIVLEEERADGETSITDKAKGTKRVLPNLGAITGPGVVQLQRSGGAPCLEAT